MRRVAAGRALSRRLQAIKLGEFCKAREDGALQHEPFLTFEGDPLLTDELLFITVSLESSFGDRAISGEENLASFRDGNHVVTYRDGPHLVAAGRVLSRVVGAWVCWVFHMALWYHRMTVEVQYLQHLDCTYRQTSAVTAEPPEEERGVVLLRALIGE